MKKRSLVAAVAMLIVSALVLTTATYAWFAAGSAATVGSIATTVSNSDGSLLVSSTNTEGSWKTALTYADFDGLFETGNTLYPVSVTPSADPAFVGCSYDGYTFEAGEAAAKGAKYLDYTWYFKSANQDKSVVLTPGFTTGTGSQFVYGLLIVNNNYYVFGANGDSYTPIKEINTKATEGQTTQNAIIDAAEVTQGALADSAVTVNAPGTITVAATADTSYSVRCIVWAEGQDAGCAGSVSNVGAGFSFSLAIAE